MRYSGDRDEMPDGGRTVRERLAARGSHSYRTDAAIPAFPDDKPLIVFDGVCVLCTSFAQFVARRDREGQFRLTAVQSPLGQALFRHYGLDTVNYETNLLIADGRVFGKMDAFAGIMRRLGWPWRSAAVLALLPLPLADWLYDRIARNRYRLFGRREVCVVPDQSWRERVID